MKDWEEPVTGILNSSWSPPSRTTMNIYITTQLPIIASSNSTWGPKRDSLYTVVPLTIIYAVIFLTGVIGNVSTCIVIARNKSMHTATNYYLFSLAISDLLLLVSGLPPEMYSMWSKFPYVFGETFCVLQGFAAETSANATVLTITAFTVERYMAICHPFLSHTMSKLSRAVKFVVMIWILALCFAIPQAMSVGLVYEVLQDGRVVEEHCICAIKRNIIPHAFEISTVLFFVAPMSLITVLYILIGLQLRRSKIVSRGRKAGCSVRLKYNIFKKRSKTVVIIDPEAAGSRGHNGLSEQQYPLGGTELEDGRKNYGRNAQSKATQHVVKMLVAVVAAFFICWAPFHAQRLLAIYGSHETGGLVLLYNVLFYTSGVLYFLSTTVNPLLYNIMSNKFRDAFRDTLARYLGRRRYPRGSRCYSNLSLRSTSQNTSQSGTQSTHSRQTSVRYFEADMLTRRPLVVSFRRRPEPLGGQPPAMNRSDVHCACVHCHRSFMYCQCEIKDSLATPKSSPNTRKFERELQEVFDTLVNKSRKNQRLLMKSRSCASRLTNLKRRAARDRSQESVQSISALQNFSCESHVQKLELSPSITVTSHQNDYRKNSVYYQNVIKDRTVGGNSPKINLPCSKIEDIEIFHEQQLTVGSIKKNNNFLKDELCSQCLNESPHSSTVRYYNSETIPRLLKMDKGTNQLFNLVKSSSYKNFKIPNSFASSTCEMNSNFNILTSSSRFQSIATIHDPLELDVIPPFRKSSSCHCLYTTLSH